jgi:hypothetical protein
VSRFLGYKDLNTTKIYALPSMEMMKYIIESASLPLSTAEKPLYDVEDEIAKNSGIR